MTDSSDVLPESAPDCRHKRPAPLRRRIRNVLRAAGVLFLILLVVGWWNVLRIDQGHHWPPPADAVTAAQAQSMTEAFARRDDPRRDDIAVDYAPSTALDIQLFDGAQEFFPAMLEDIADAEDSIHIAMFAFTSGDWGQTFADALIAKSLAGVEVRLSVDRFGSRATSDSEAMFNRMADAGIEIVVNDVFPMQASGYLPDRNATFSQDEVGQVDHRKILVIDGRVGWLGGAGFEDHFFTGAYHDVFVRVQGDVVRQLQAVFLTGFRAYGGTLPTGEGSLARYFPAPDAAGTIRVTVLQNVPGGFRPATEATYQLLENASERIDILNPYIADHGIIDRLRDAAADRGVAVNVVVPAESNNPPAEAAFKHHYPKLISAGVRIWEYPEVLHAKVLVADDAAIVGSLNYDAWALYRNVEISLLIEDADVADLVRDTFVAPTVEQSSPADTSTSTGDEIRNWFWDKLTYFL